MSSRSDLRWICTWSHRRLPASMNQILCWSVLTLKSKSLKCFRTPEQSVTDPFISSVTVVAAGYCQAYDLQNSFLCDESRHQGDCFNMPYIICRNHERRHLPQATAYKLLTLAQGYSFIIMSGLFYFTFIRLFICATGVQDPGSKIASGWWTGKKRFYFFYYGT